MTGATPGGADTLKIWERWIGHIGYFSEGFVYLLIGGFALLAELHRRRQPNGSLGAFAELATTPLGRALLALLALGLAAFILWQLIMAVVDPEFRRERTSGRRRLVRLGHLFTAVLYSVLVGEAIWQLLGYSARDAGEGAQRRWTLWAMQLPLGRYAVGAVGVGIGIFALAQFYRAVTSDKTKRVDLRKTRLRIAIKIAGAYGYISRSVLFGLVGLYLVDAAWRFDPRYSGGFAGALHALQQRPYGNWLLGTVAFGLMSYGAFQIVKERYRRFFDHSGRLSPP
ncbi:MAG TPA: DUF1206 domain-containing protein [Steroidobacteraceae bacterium]|jgi:hypothetical protein|nr:DUF1206 domain-containing protein [Steroidobacteraceae bacterium]